MAIFGVLLHNGDEKFGDRPDQKYVVRSPWLRHAKALEGSSILYYRPVSSRRPPGYFAVAMIEQVQTDAWDSDRHFALIQKGTFIEFPQPVPLTIEGAPLERTLLNSAGRISGRTRSPVRQIEKVDFDIILALGLPDTDHRLIEDEKSAHGSGFSEAQPFITDEPIVRGFGLYSKPIRLAAFRRLILETYKFRCAMGGPCLSFVRHDGTRAYEVEAAHIHSVEDSGPDVRYNGVALSRTLHWAFDSGILSISDDHEILVSSRIEDPSPYRQMINPSGRLLLPRCRSGWPHPSFLLWHRTHRFERHGDPASVRRGLHSVC